MNFMSDRADDDQGPSDPDRLTGWKEIAAFLGKGVRTAQRWEKEYGLPVSRIGREGGEIIFTSRRKLTAWLESGAGRVGAAEAEHDSDSPPEAPGGVTPGAPSRSTRRGLWRWAVVPGLLGLGLLATWAFQADDLQPDHWVVANDTLVVYDAEGRELFTFAPGHDLPETEYAQPFAGENGGLVAIRDLDGDGRSEVILMAVGPATGPDNALFILNDDGTVRARMQPVRTVRFGETDYAAPWQPSRIFVNDTPGGLPRLHAAFVHGMNFPTLLLELDAHGNRIAEYWSNGYVTDVRFVSWHGFRVLAVGAANNDLRGASLALFESGRAQGAAPAQHAAYACSTCPAGEPTAFVVFPGRCLTRSVNGTATASHIWTDAQGSLFVTISEGTPNHEGLPIARVVYKLDADLKVLQAEPLTVYFAEHDNWYREGHIDHPLSPERDGPDMFPVRTWTEGGFVDQPPGRIDWSGLDRR